VLIILLGTFSFLPPANAAGSSCISLGFPSVTSSTTAIRVSVTATSSCKTPFGMSNGGAVYTILSETSFSSSCSGPYDYSNFGGGTISCTINLGGALGSSRAFATSSTIHIWFAYDSSSKDVTFSHSAIPSKTSGGTSGGGGSSGSATPVTPSCTAAPSTPVLSIEWNSIGPKFVFSPAISGQKATSLFWSYSLWNSSTKNWEGWSSWSMASASAGSYQAAPIENKSKIAFAVQATNACGASAQAREREDQTGVSLTPQQQDEISRNTKSSPDLKVGLDVDLYLVAASKFDLELSARSLSPEICTVNETQILLKSVGICKLAVSSTTFEYELGAKPTEIQFEVTRIVGQSIPNLNLKSSYFLSTKSLELLLRTDAALTVRFKSLSPKTCDVLGSTLSLINTGSCILEASQEGDVNTLPAPMRNFEIWIDSDPLKSLTCIKGKVSKKITGPNPKCPPGYKVKK